VRLRIEQRNKKLPRLLTSGWAIDSVEDPGERVHPSVNSHSWSWRKYEAVCSEHLSETRIVRGRDVDRPLRVAREVDAGTIWINDWAVVYDEFEEGGFKESGNGRLNGWTAIDEFLEYKHIAFHSGTIREAESSGNNA
jgi:hypothetical protein